MKKLLSYLLCLHFLAISFVPSSKVVELYKLNHLFSHFTHHQVVHHEDINFIEFLILHYLDKKHEHHDGQEHSDLPFQSSEQQAAANLNFVFTSPTFFSWNFKIYHSKVIDKQMITYQENNFPSFHLSIWQPPKVGIIHSSILGFSCDNT